MQFSFSKHKFTIAFTLFFICLVLSTATGWISEFREQGQVGVVRILIDVILPAGILYYTYRWRQMATYALAIVMLIVPIPNAVLSIYDYFPDLGLANVFNPYTGGLIATQNLLSLILIVLSIPAIVLFAIFWLGLYKVRKEVRSLSPDGILNAYTDAAGLFRQAWVSGDKTIYDEANKRLGNLYYEMLRRDPRLNQLYSLLNYQDDYVKITAARQLLRSDDDRALQTLDKIVSQKSEWSNHAKNMADQWRAGKLKSWATAGDPSTGEKVFFISYGGVALVVFAILIYSLSNLHQDFVQKQMSAEDIYPTTPGFLLYTAQQPAASLAPVGATWVPFTAFTLTNNTSNPVTVEGVTVEATGLTDEAGISKVELVDNGLEVDNPVSLDSQHRAVIGGTFVIPAGVTKTYTVAANISSCTHACADDTEKLYIAVIGIKTSTNLLGQLPITGAGQTINAELKIGSVTAVPVNISNPPTISTNSSNITFAKLQFTNTGNEDQRLYSIRFAYSGTLNFNDLSNVQVNASGTDYPTAWATDGSYVTATFLNGVPLSKGSTMDVSIQGDASVAGNQGKTVEFDIPDPSEVYFVGQTFGYGVAPSSANSSTTMPWFKGNVFSLGQ